MVTTHLHSYFIWDCFNSQRATKETFKTGKKYIYILGFFLFFFGARSRGAGDGAPLGPLQKGEKKRDAFSGWVTPILKPVLEKA